MHTPSLPTLLIRFGGLVASFAALLAAGCSTPKHSNVLVFGTNTAGGIDVSFNPKTQQPGLLVGYRRQEAVWMPLLANVSRSSDAAGSPEVVNAPSACEIASESGNPSQLLYIGREGAGNNQAVDTYSVLASFGAKFAAGGSGTATATGGAAPQAKVEASGGLAQFFATGLAARKLAEQGGEALVSVHGGDKPSQARPAAAEANAEKAKAEADRAATELERIKIAGAQIAEAQVKAGVASKEAALAAIGAINRAGADKDKLAVLRDQAQAAGILSSADVAAYATLTDANITEFSQKLIRACLNYADAQASADVAVITKFSETANN